MICMKEDFYDIQILNTKKECSTSEVMDLATISQPLVGRFFVDVRDNYLGVANLIRLSTT